MGQDSCSDQLYYPQMAEFDEQSWISYYFQHGYEYDEILHFLKDYHDYKISRSTLLRRLKMYGLHRRSGGDLPDELLQRSRNQILADITGPQSSNGYRAVWYSLRLKGIHVPRCLVQNLLKEVDPEGSALRRKHRLKRRTYSNPGPDYAWH